MTRDGVANIVYRLLERCFDPRRVARDAWESRCPAHGSADHALSISRDENIIRELFRSGANGYLLKEGAYQPSPLSGFAKVREKSGS